MHLTWYYHDGSLPIMIDDVPVIRITKFDQILSNLKNVEKQRLINLHLPSLV